MRTQDATNCATQSEFHRPTPIRRRCGGPRSATSLVALAATLALGGCTSPQPVAEQGPATASAPVADLDHQHLPIGDELSRYLIDNDVKSIVMINNEGKTFVFDSGGHPLNYAEIVPKSTPTSLGTCLVGNIRYTCHREAGPYQNKYHLNGQHQLCPSPCQ
jgi:hypothetical protein